MTRKAFPHLLLLAVFFTLLSVVQNISTHSANSGVRDGEFVKSSNWDLPGEDQTRQIFQYFPDLKGNVSGLKEAVLDKQGNQFLAFNTTGWIKSWAILDFRNFCQVQGTDLYVRMEYPGWHFIQGKNSPENGLGQIEGVSTSTGLIEATLERYQGDNKVAAFNTNGWVKSRVVYPLCVLSGIYVQTKFLDYNFYSNLDSNGNDIKQTPEYTNDIPAFNANGWHKYALEGPPPTASPPSFNEPYQGVYYRTCWPDFVYLPGLDSPGNNIRNVGDKQLFALLNEARNDPIAIAVNTGGWLKRSLVDEPQDTPGAENLKGIYTADKNTLLSTAFFSLKGTVNIWCRWILKGADARQMYRAAVGTATADILERVENGSFTPAAGAAEAHQMRKQFLTGMRNKTSPIGLLVARSIKPAGGSYQYYLDRNAEIRYGNRVSFDTIHSAGRAKPKVTEVMRNAGTISQGVLVVAVSVSVYSVAIAQDWEDQLGTQTSSWSRSIADGELGVGVGTIFGPVGAILGGIAGSILGGLEADVLANWFFGGSMGSRAVELLGFALEPATRLVEEKLSKNRCGYYTHIIRASHVAKNKTSEINVEGHAVLVEMVENIPDPIKLQAATFGSSDEVLATIVWIRVEGRTLPTNSRNPADLVELMEYVKKNIIG
ncbi:hypothetical protein F4779DRAFT_633209 [Xylariaceae sp. FL0662B]|nr:hypothetical protein F4779DRAFT_633209 [Xylariaceae sp. FL0662B]